MGPMESVASNETQLLNEEFEKRARKREQNRISQRTYRKFNGAMTVSSLYDNVNC